METTALSKLYVDKLGHNLGEIRLRALNHIISKLNRNLISSKDIALNSEFINQLLRWFDHEPIVEEEKVINLLLKLIKSNEDARLYWKHIGVPRSLRSARKKISTKSRQDLDKILDLFALSEDNENKSVEYISHPERSVETEFSSFDTYFDGEAENDQLSQLRLAGNLSRENELKKHLSYQPKSMWYPLQPLSPGDLHVLSSVEQTLSTELEKHLQHNDSYDGESNDRNNVDQEDTLIRCCQFVFDVILRDFFPEVFLQQPGIVSTLLDLLSTLGLRLHPGFIDESKDGKAVESLKWIIKCLHRLATSLHVQLLFYADAGIPNLKDNTVMSSGNGTSNASNSLVISPVGNPKYRTQDAKLRHSDHLSLPPDNLLTPVNYSSSVSGFCQFSLPHFCISVLFQSLTLITAHLSGSHSRIFQSLMSLSSASLQLLSRIVDPDMWVSVNPVSSAVTAGISEILRILGEGLLSYQRYLFQKKDNSLPHSSVSQSDKRSQNLSSTISKYSFSNNKESSRLAYIQVLFLTHSFLALSPKDPSLCRSSVPEEVAHALMIAIFDPSLQLFFPKLHLELLRVVKCVSQEAERVCEQALKLAESVKMGIKVLSGTKKTYKDVRIALPGLAFHESKEIIRKCWDCCMKINYQECSEAIKLTKHDGNGNRLEKACRNQPSSSSAKSRGTCNSQTGLRKSIGSCKPLSPLSEAYAELCINGMKNYVNDHDCQPGDEKGILSESESRISVILKLLAHESNMVQREVYSYCWEIVAKLLGTDSAKDIHSRVSRKPAQKVELEQLSFLWNTSVFTEIIIHGTQSTDTKIQKCATEIILFVLKSKIIVGEKIWSEIMETFITCLPLLLCFADSETHLGKAITRMFDPDISPSIGLSTFHAIRGNCNLLFNSDPAVRDEAATRLAWLLTHESMEETNGYDSIVIDSWKNINNRLPDRDTLALSGRSSLSNVFVFQPEDNAFNVPAKCFPSSYVYQAENVIQLLSLIEKRLDGDVSLSDARLCCSALNQLALTLEKNCQLHSAFLLNSGINIILRIFQGALVEDDCEHYPDCSVPIVNILKNIAHWSSKVRKDLSHMEVVFHCILRAIILFYDEKAFRIDAAHLLCLLLFNDYILVLTPTPSPTASLSLPYILSQNVHIPFPCSSHWRTSHHSTTTPLSPSLMQERDNPLPEEILSWKGSNKFKERLPWQGLIRLHGSWEWYGRELLLNVKERKKTPAVFESKDLEELNQPFPLLLQMSSSEINDFIATDIISSCRSQLFDIQNSTTHLSVERALNMLSGYVSIWNATLAEGGKLMETKWDTSLTPWNGTLGRFLLRSPANHQDSELLIQVCSFLQTAVEGKAASNILEKRDKNGQKHNWLEELLQNPTTLQPLLCPFNPSSSDFPGTVCFTQEAFDGCPSQRAVCREVLSLIREISGNDDYASDSQKIGWAHAIYFIAQSLQFGDAEHFYDLAFLEWALSCLVQLTGKTGWGPGLNEITAKVNKNRSENDHILIWEGLISGLIEILTAFHHGGQSLPVWTSEDGRPDLNERGMDNMKRRSANSEDGIRSTESLEVSGSFMGLSITRSALLCLNHILSEMQNTCTQASKDNWEIVWSRVLINAGRNEKRGHMRSLWQESLQGWLLSHWFSRDTIVRAAALKLASGITAISSPANVSASVKKAKRGQSAQENVDSTFGLKLLEEGLSQKPGGMWGTILSIFLDNFESNIVREQAATLLSNLISASEQIPEQAADMLRHESPFFKEIGVLASQLFLSSSLQQPLSSIASKCIDEGGIKSIMWCTPSLLQAACKLLKNITVLKPGVISSVMWENNGYLFRRLYGCLGKIPKGRKQNHMETMLYVDVLGLYSEILSLLTSIMIWDSRLEILLPQPHPLTAVFLLLESKKYREGEEFENLKNRLWKKAFGFILVAIGSLVDRQANSLTIKDADIVLEMCYSVFLDAVYESVTGNDMELKKSALYSLNALFSLEMQCSISQAEAVELNKDDRKAAFSLVELFDSPCEEHGEEKTELMAKMFPEVSLFEKGSKSAQRISHLLINLYQPERASVTEVCIPLSSLLAMSTKAKWCALSSGLMENIVSRCKNLYVTIIIGESDDSFFSQTNFMRGSAGKKQSPKQWMGTMSLLFRLLTNFLHSGTNESLGNESPAADFLKIEAVRLGLSDVLHKMCPFAMLASSLLLDLLRLLTTFTTDCFPACQSLIHTSKAVGTGPCQNLLSSSLIHLLCDLATKEMDSLWFVHLASQSKKSMEENMKESLEILGAVFASLRNACDVQECRAVLIKGTLLPSLLKLRRNEKKINSMFSEMMEDLWLPFLLQLTTYSEGQLALPKIPDMFDLLLSLSKLATCKRYSFLSVLRNLSLNSQNRTRFLSSEEFLKLLIQVLSKPDKRFWQKEEAAIIVHALCSNNHKAKQILKGVGVENALREAISILWAADGCEDVSQESISSTIRGGIRTEIERVVNVLRNSISVLGNDIDERHSL